MKIKNKMWYVLIVLAVGMFAVLAGLALKDKDFIAADTFNAADFFTGDGDCLYQYGLCIEASRTLPGSVYDKPMSSPFTIAWAACSAASTACVEGKKANKEPAPAPAPTTTSTPAPTSTPSTSTPTTTKSVTKELPLDVKISAVKGEVEYRRKGESEDRPFTKDVVLQEGDTILTGDKGNVTLALGGQTGQTLSIYPWTSFRVDESLSKDNIKRTKLYLEVGAIAGKVKHTAAIRSDFAVTTPNANASIRGSAMTVQYDKESGVTSVYVTEDAADVWGKGPGLKQAVKKGYMVTVGADGKVSKPVRFKQSDLAKAKKGKKR